MIEQAEAFIAATDTHGVETELILTESHCVEQAIAHAAYEHAADLVVMSSRNRSRAAAVIHAGLAAGTIRLTRTSFLVLKSSNTPVGIWQALRERLGATDPLQVS